MRKLCILLFILTINLCFCQEKSQLIDSIIKVNEFHSNCTGAVCEKSKQYLNWVQLKNQLSIDELIKLTTHQHPIIRTYAATELIKTNKYPLSSILMTELSRSAIIETLDGCLGDYESTASIIYHEYWNKIRYHTFNNVPENKSEKELIIFEKIKNDIELKKADSIIMFSKTNIDPSLYSRALSNRAYKKAYNSRILEILTHHNDYTAFYYLNKQYPEEYDQEFARYFRTHFLKAKFKTEDEIYDLLGFIEFLISHKTSEFKKIAVTKLKSDDSWKIEEDFFMESLEKNGIKL